MGLSCVLQFVLGILSVACYAVSGPELASYVDSSSVSIASSVLYCVYVNLCESLKCRYLKARQNLLQKLTIILS